jgi:hypothetical protein
VTSGPREVHPTAGLRDRLGRGALAAEMDALKLLVQRYEQRRLRPVPPS